MTIPRASLRSCLSGNAEHPHLVPRGHFLAWMRQSRGQLARWSGAAIPRTRSPSRRPGRRTRGRPSEGDHRRPFSDPIVSSRSQPACSGVGSDVCWRSRCEAVRADVIARGSLWFRSREPSAIPLSRVPRASVVRRRGAMRCRLCENLLQAFHGHIVAPGRVLHSAPSQDSSI